jgi:hypothetical protein
MLAVPLALPAYRGGVRRLISETYRAPVREQIAALERKRPLGASESAALYIGDPSVQQDFAVYIADYTFQRQIPVYTADTLDLSALPDVLYALGTDGVTGGIAQRKAAEIVTP